MHYSLALVTLGSALSLTNALAVPINAQGAVLERRQILAPEGLTLGGNLPHTAPTPLPVVGHNPGPIKIPLEGNLPVIRRSLERRQRLPGKITLPTKAQGQAPSPVITTCKTASIQANINQWQSDITNVNNFLNTATALSPAAVSAQAANLQRNCPGDAGNEPSHLKALAPCGAPDDDSVDDGGDGSVATLEQIFPGVLGNLSIITANANNPTIVGCAVSAIDYLRCNQVLPDIQSLFSDVFSNDASITNIVVNGPTACEFPDSGSYPSPAGVNLASCGPTATTKALFCEPTLNL